MSSSAANAVKTINGADVWTDPVTVDPNAPFAVDFDNTNFVGTFSVQFSDDNGANWVDLDNAALTSGLDYVKDGQRAKGGMVRAGCKSGNYTSGSGAAEVYYGR